MTVSDSGSGASDLNYDEASDLAVQIQSKLSETAEGRVSDDELASMINAEIQKVAEKLSKSDRKEFIQEFWAGEPVALNENNLPM